MSSGSSSRVLAWLRLLRVPNFATVPGDPIAGFFLAGGIVFGVSPWRAAAAVGVSLCLYAVGMLLNDLVDVEEDRRERPSRPLADGAVPLSHVRTTIIALLVAAGGMALAAGGWTFAVACGLAFAVLAYNFRAKRVAGVGVLTMGLCRGLSVLLGASSVRGLGEAPSLVFVGAGCVTAYIISVSVVARLELQPAKLTLLRWLPLTVCAAIGVILKGLGRMPEAAALLLSMVLTVLLVGTSLAAAIRIGRAGSTEGFNADHLVPAQIGSLIRALVFLQALLIVLSGPSETSLAAAAAVAALWVPGKIAGQWIYAS